MKLKKSLKISCLLLVLTITGCAISHSFTENGERYHVIRCDGKLVDISLCYQKAKKICPNGYNVIDKNVKHHNNFPLNTYMGIATGILEVMDTPGVFKGIKVQCK